MVMGGDERVDELVNEAINFGDVDSSIRQLVDMLENSQTEVRHETKIIAALVTVARRYPEKTLIELASRVTDLPDDLRYKVIIVISGIVDAYPEAGRHESVMRPLEQLSEHVSLEISYHAQKSLYNINHPPEDSNTKSIKIYGLSQPQVINSEIYKLENKTYELEEKINQHLSDYEQISEAVIKINRLENSLGQVQEQIPDEQMIRNQTEKVVDERLNKAIDQDVPQTAQRVAVETIEDTAKQRIDDLVSKSVPSHYGENIYIPVFKTVIGTGIVVSIFSVIIALLLGSVPLAVVFIITTLFLTYSFQYGLEQGDSA